MSFLHPALRGRSRCSQIKTCLSVLLMLSAQASATGEPLDRQFARPLAGHPDNIEFRVNVPTAVTGECLSYWGNAGKNWATLILDKGMLVKLAADGETRAQRLLNDIDTKPDAWGCQHIPDTQGAPLELVFDLIESGSVMVIEDASGQPVPQVLVRFPADQHDRSSYHLRKEAGAFLTRDPEKLKQQETDYEFSMHARAPWSIERLPVTSTNRAQIQFAKSFISSCTSDDWDKTKFLRAHIRVPLRYRYNVVDEAGAHGEDEILKKLTPDRRTGSIGLPICAGDGSLDDVALRQERSGIVLELEFGSGPAEELHFRLVKGQWMLTFAEWFDH